MKVIKSYKYRIYPNAEQKQYFAQAFGNVRFIYNKILSDKIAHYEATGENLTIYPARYKEEFEFLKLTDSLMLNTAKHNVEQAYKNFFRNPKHFGFPKFKRKTNTMSCNTGRVGNNIRIENGRLKIPRIESLEIRMERELPENSKINNVTITKTASGKYFAAINFEYEFEVKAKSKDEIKKVVGLDYSMPNLYVSSSGEMPDYPKFFRKAQVRLAKEQRKLSRMKKDSNNYQKQRIKVARAHETIANQRRDFLHKESRKIANFYDLVCIEDLNMQNMAKSLNFGKSVHDNSWGMFTAMLNYKLAEQGKHLLRADKWFPSSKQCSHCYELKADLELGDRIYECSACGFSTDRDLNAAYNLKNYALQTFGLERGL